MALLIQTDSEKSLVRTLNMVVLLVVSTVFGISALYSYHIQQQQMLSEVEGQAVESAERLSKTITPYIESFEINQYANLIETETQTDNHYALSAIVLHDYKMGAITGEDFYITGRLRDTVSGVRVYEPENALDKEILESSYTSKITQIHSVSGEHLGTLFIYVNDKEVRENLSVLLQRTIAITLALLFIVSLLLIFFLQRFLIKPLNLFSSAMSDRDEDGVPKSNIPSSDYREIAVLADTVNDMLAVTSQARDKVRLEHQNLENVINATRAGTWYWNIQTGEAEFNERWAEILGFSLNELKPVSIDTWLSLVHPDDLQVSEQLLESYFNGQIDFYECETRMRHKAGHWVWILESGKVTKWTEAGEPLEMFGTHLDITARKHDEEQLALAASVYKQVHEGILITNKQGRIVDVNDAFTRITGYSKEDVIGKSPGILKSGRHGKDFYAILWRSLKRQGFWSGEVWNKRKNGEVYPELITISAVKSKAGDIDHYVALFSDITSIKEHEFQLQQIAHYDTLTGLPNRLLLRDRLRVAMTRAKSHNQPLALLFLDLDGFKAVNDSYGHDIGDQLLIVLAERIPSLLKEDDTFARLGGDEFIVILPDITDIESVDIIVQRILDSISDSIRVGELELQVSGSLGVALYPDDDDIDADQLIRQADQAMYHAKLAGKNCFHFFDPEQDRTLRDINETILRLEAALIANEFELYYQPKVNLRTGGVVGVEGLIRWNHPDQGTLSPAAFLPAIEDHILMVEVGQWTLEQGLMQLERWRQQGLSLSVSINIAAIHLQQADFFSQLENLLDKYPLVSPNKLQLEVLETSALENVEQVQMIIKQCEKIGVVFAIDDFGTGYSTLSYLKQLPARILKIDQSFVKHMNDESDDLLILEAVISLAKAFKKEVIAEGLEDINQANMLLDMGCELAQGYGIARPMPAADIQSWIDDWNNSKSKR